MREKVVTIVVTKWMFKYISLSEIVMNFFGPYWLCFHFIIFFTFLHDCFVSSFTCIEVFSHGYHKNCVLHIWNNLIKQWKDTKL